MNKNFARFVLAGAITANVLGVNLAVPAVFAAESAATEVAKTGNWATLGVGQQASYAFEYAGDDSQITVQMSLSPNNSASFEILTPEQIAKWQQGDEITPVGRGSESDVYSGDLLWTGHFNTAGQYYVVVKQTGSTNANYALKISGDGVSLPKTASNTSTANQPSTTIPEKSQPEKVETKSGQSPNEALTASGEWASLEPGQQVWYAIPYQGDGSQIRVQMSVDSANSAEFEVWTPEQIAQSAHDETIQPVGRGAVDNALGGDLVWTGNFNVPGTYYIVVHNNIAHTAYYSLSIK